MPYVPTAVLRDYHLSVPHGQRLGSTVPESITTQKGEEKVTLKFYSVQKILQCTECVHCGPNYSIISGE